MLCIDHHISTPYTPYYGFVALIRLSANVIISFARDSGLYRKASVSTISVSQIR